MIDLFRLFRYSLRKRNPVFIIVLIVTSAVLVYLISMTQSNLQKLSTPGPSAVQNNLFLVSKVIDGDTIELQSGEKVRYIGVDTPETTLGKNDCYGADATNKNKQLVEGKYVRLEKDVSEKDKFGRLLRYVYLGETFVNDYLVRQGYANIDTVPPDVKFSEQFASAAREARENNRGLWGSCSLDQIKGATAESPDKDCSDFKTQNEAQEFFISQGGPQKDPHKLDSDRDGIVCTSLP